MSNPTPQTQHNQNHSLPRIKRPKKGMHLEDIKGELRKRGYTLDRLSKETGRHRSSLSAALRHSWPSVEIIIAQALGRKPWEVWPERYNDYGQPVQTANPNMVMVGYYTPIVNVEDGGKKTT